MIFPYFGKLPAQYNMWRESALRNPSVDFMFFTDADVEPAPNIIVHKMKFEEFRQYIQAVFDFPIVLDRPYILCDHIHQRRSAYVLLKLPYSLDSRGQSPCNRCLSPHHYYTWSNVQNPKRICSVKGPLQ